MKNTFIVLFLLLASINYAQDKPFQVSAGVNQSWFNYEEDILEELENKFRPKFDFSIHYKYGRAGNFNFTAGFRYHHLGRSIEYTYEGPQAQMYTETATIDHYLFSFPLRAKYLIKSINTAFLINLEFGYNTKSNVEQGIPGEDVIERDVTDEMNSLQYFIGAGAEYYFKLGNNLLSLTALFNYGISNYAKEDTFINEFNQEFTWAKYKASEVLLSISWYLGE